MVSVSPTTAALLDVARDFVSQRDLDIEDSLILLANMPMDELDVQIRGAVQHARMVATAGQNRKDTHTAVARFALARVVVLLEQHVAASQVRQPDREPGLPDTL